jgi:membrane associated rhomboid family serine protease
MNEFMMTHPILTVSVIGSIIGTILSYIAPGFTTDYLCAGRGFRIGNFGLNVFIHNGWGHLAGNLFFMFPGALMVDSMCNHHPNMRIAVVAIIIVATIIGELPIIFSRQNLCGYSEIAFLLIEMGLVYYGRTTKYGFFLYAIAILVAGVTIGSDVYSKHNYKFGHILGLSVGALSGYLFSVIFN